MLVTALALPVIATATRFPDVPDDHQYVDAIRWASDPEQFNGNPLFRGYPDGNFGPDQELTEGQFVKVVDRLFDSIDDGWTRAETATLLYHGYKGIRSTTTQPVVIETTTTTRPVVIETTTTTIQPHNPDHLLKVGFYFDQSRNFFLRWVRPGWESQGWKWRVLTNAPDCGGYDDEVGSWSFTNGVGRWQVERGWWNGFLDDSGRALPFCLDEGTHNWQIEIVWDNGQRFVSSPCVTRGFSTRTSLPIWNCNTPNDLHSWPIYRKPVTTTTYPVVIETTTTTTTTTTTIQPHNPDRQLKVAIRLDVDDNFDMSWIRPGWESQGWKWRLHTDDPRCDGSNIYEEVNIHTWQTNRGYDNDWHSFWGLCVNNYGYEKYIWQIEIVWDNGQRFVSSPCVVRGYSTEPVVTGSPIWDCNAPYGWKNWPDYADIPPSLSFIDTEFYSESNEIASFDIVLSADRDDLFAVDLCGIRRELNLVEGDNRLRVHCPSEQDTTRLEVIYIRGRAKRLVNEFISIPTGTNTQLNAQQLNPQVRVIEEPQNPDIKDSPTNIIVEAIVGNSDIARNSTATGSLYYSGTDYDGNRLLHVRNMKFVDDRFRLQLWSPLTIDSDFNGTIQINEPGAPTHHLIYNNQMVVQSDSNTESETS